MRRCVIFVSPAVYRIYHELAVAAGISRSSLINQVLGASVDTAESIAATGRGLPARGASAQPSLPGTGDASSESSRSAPSARTDPDGVLASLEQFALRTLEASPALDLEGLRRLVSAGAYTFLGSPPPDHLLERAVTRVFTQRPDDRPRPVGGNEPPV